MKCSIAIHTAGGKKRPRSKKGTKGEDGLREKPRSEKADKGKGVDPRE